MAKGNFSIRQWAEGDRPREKLLQKGRSTLSDAELLAILLGSGSKQFSAVQLAQFILTQANNDLNHLARLSSNDLIKFPGMGSAKASAVIAALELGRRRKETKVDKRMIIRSSKSVHEHIKDLFFDLEFEEFWLLILNRGNEVISRKRISQGGVSGTVADNKLIFKYALENLGTSIVVIHNHPSGNLEPSQADLNLTKKIRQAAENLDIQLLDHLIVSNDRYFSFADEGLL